MSRPVTVACGPYAAADDDVVSLSQKAAGAQYLVINGVGSDVLATGVAAVQTVSGATALTLNGTLVTGGVAYIRQPGGRQVYITSSGDDSGITFAIVGTITSPTGITFYQSQTVTGANASTVCSSKYFSSVVSITTSGSAAANVSAGMNGVGTVDTVQRYLILTSGGNDTGITFTVTGTNAMGPVSQVVTGASGGAAVTTVDFLTVTSILTSAAVATTIKVGTRAATTVGASPWVRLDSYGAMAETSIQVTVTGTVAYTVQQTLQDPGSPTNPVAYSSIAWVNHPDTALVAATSTAQGNYAYNPIWARVQCNSYTTTGAVSAVFQQTYQT